MAEYLTGRLSANLRGWKQVRSVFAVVFLIAGLAPTLSAGGSPSGDSDTTLLRVGFSSSMFVDVNENDVRAAMKVWAQVLFKERGLPVNSEMTLLNGHEEISRALRSKLIEAFALGTDEYWAVEKEMQSGQVVVGVFDGRVTEEYVLLAHRESGIERVGDLRGRNVTLFQNPRMSLGTIWLDTFLLKEGLGHPSKFFGRVTQVNKLPKVILPVFFRQNDACLVTRRGFQTMCELNPQVGRQLKVVASSSELVPAGFFFRGDFSPSIKDKALAEFDHIHTTPAGQQALTVFQSGKLEVHPISVLNSAFELMNSHKRLCATADGLKTTEGRSAPREAIAGVK